jgi:hypothetical protein
MSISTPVLATKEQLIRVMQDPVYAASVGIPSYKAMVQLQEMNQPKQEAPQQVPTVAQQVISQSVPHQGIGSINPMMAQQQQAMMQQAQPEQEPTPQMMAQGGLAELDTGDMFNEHNYAGGGIVAFAKGGKATDTSAYDPWYYNSPEAVLARVPKELTLDDEALQMQQAQNQFGVDPEFYKKQAAELQKQRDELKDDKAQAGWMALANLGFGAASAKPEYGKAQNTLSTWGGSALNAAKELGVDLKDIQKEDKLLKQADMKLKEAKNAQARGDAATAIKAMDERKNIITNVELKNAELVNASNIAKAKNAATTGGARAKVQSSVYGNALKDFANAFPNGAQETVFGGDPGFFQYVKNNYIKNAKEFIMNDQMPSIPTASQLRTMYDDYRKGAGAKPAANTTTNKLNANRPAHIDAIMNKYSDNTNKKIRNTNTQDELDTNWDSAGTGLDEE